MSAKPPQAAFGRIWNVCCQALGVLSDVQGILAGVTHFDWFVVHWQNLSNYQGYTVAVKFEDQCCQICHLGCTRDYLAVRKRPLKDTLVIHSRPNPASSTLQKCTCRVPRLIAVGCDCLRTAQLITVHALATKTRRIPPTDRVEPAKGLQSSEGKEGEIPFTKSRCGTNSPKTGEIAPCSLLERNWCAQQCCQPFGYQGGLLVQSLFLLFFFGPHFFVTCIYYTTWRRQRMTTCVRWVQFHSAKQGKNWLENQINSLTKIPLVSPPPLFDCPVARAKTKQTTRARDPIWRQCANK